MNQSVGAVAQIKKNALINKGEVKGAPAKVAPKAKGEKAPKEVTVKEPRQTLAQKCEAIAKGVSWDDACKLTKNQAVMIYNMDQGRWQKAHFVTGGKDTIQAILCGNLFVIDRKRWNEGNENGQGIIAPGKEIATPTVNEEKVRKAFLDHPDYRTLPVWKDQYKDMIAEVEKKTPAKKAEKK